MDHNSHQSNSNNSHVSTTSHQALVVPISSKQRPSRERSEDSEDPFSCTVVIQSNPSPMLMGYKIRSKVPQVAEIATHSKTYILRAVSEEKHSLQTETEERLLQT